MNLLKRMAALPTEQHLAGSRATLKLDGVAYNAGGNLKREITPIVLALALNFLLVVFALYI